MSYPSPTQRRQSPTTTNISRDTNRRSSFPPSSTAFVIRSSTSFFYVFGFTLAVAAFTIFFVFNKYDSPVRLPNGSHFYAVFSRFFSATSSSSPQISVTPFRNPTLSISEEDNGFSGKIISSSPNLTNHCNIYDGSWVRDDSYPLNEAGSCPYIDDQFNCFLNDKPDNEYEKFRWQPNACNIPRLNGRKLLELLRGKRLVYVGDSLNRNMWESMICILRSSVDDKGKVFEASGRQGFRTGDSYCVVFADYNFSVEFFWSPFLVQKQEWKMVYREGYKRSTLRLDLLEKSSEAYRSADILIFNTGHWWTRGRTARGKGFFQEGNHIYNKLNVMEAFGKAMVTWARWVDANVDPSKTVVFFRGYSLAHFRGGQWNSGGQCDSETEPIKNASYLSEYPQKMRVLEGVKKGMKMPIFYMNVTKMTDYRKDAHPSIYRKQRWTKEEKQSPLQFQDCSHWCLPGVPDTWNELLYVQLLKHYKQQQH